MITCPLPALRQKQEGLQTPKSAKAIRHFQVWYKEEPTHDKVKKLFATTLYLFA